MAKNPQSVSIRSYHVGFGDCFLLSFTYGPRSERHVLIDFGSTGVPKGTDQNRRMLAIANDIKQRTGGKLDAVVATHRHKDHISGFTTAKNGKGTGDIISALNPKVVVQPWTEDPSLAIDATGPKRKRFGEATPKHIAALASMEIDGLTPWDERSSFPPRGGSRPRARDLRPGDSAPLKKRHAPGKRGGKGHSTVFHGQ